MRKPSLNCSVCIIFDFSCSIGCPVWLFVSGDVRLPCISDARHMDARVCEGDVDLAVMPVIFLRETWFVHRWPEAVAPFLDVCASWWHWPFLKSDDPASRPYFHVGGMRAGLDLSVDTGVLSTPCCWRIVSQSGSPPCCCDGGASDLFQRTCSAVVAAVFSVGLVLGNFRICALCAFRTSRSLFLR